MIRARPVGDDHCLWPHPPPLFSVRYLRPISDSASSFRDLIYLLSSIIRPWIISTPNKIQSGIDCLYPLPLQWLHCLTRFQCPILWPLWPPLYFSLFATLALSLSILTYLLRAPWPWYTWPCPDYLTLLTSCCSRYGKSGILSWQSCQPWDNLPSPLNTVWFLELGIWNLALDFWQIPPLPHQ